MMTVEQCYTQLGGDYADITRRMGTDERVIKFLGMLLRDGLPRGAYSEGSAAEFKPDVPGQGDQRINGGSASAAGE